MLNQVFVPIDSESKLSVCASDGSYILVLHIHHLSALLWLSEGLTMAVDVHFSIQNLCFLKELFDGLQSSHFLLYLKNISLILNIG